MTSEETATAPDGDTATSAPPPAPGGAATFRAVPLVALVAVGFVAIGVSPIAFLGGPWWCMFLIPVALAWWVVRTRTVVDADALRVVSAWGVRSVAWRDVATLRVESRGGVRAVRSDEREVALPGVRVRHLGRLAAASGGRISMPTQEEVEAAREHARELEATRRRIARLREREAAATSGDATGGDATGGDPSGGDASGTGPEERA